MLNGVDPFGSDEGHGDRNLMNFIADNYWSENDQNWDAEYPRLGLTKVQIANNMVPSTYWKRNGNFIRFKTLEIGYSFPHCRVFVSGDNLAVWSRSSSGTRNSLIILTRCSVPLISVLNLVFNL